MGKPSPGCSSGCGTSSCGSAGMCSSGMCPHAG
jgi:hypothetical protein